MKTAKLATLASKRVGERERERMRVSTTPKRRLHKTVSCLLFGGCAELVVRVSESVVEIVMGRERNARKWVYADRD